MYIVDAQDAGASPPGSAPHLQWGQVGDQNLGMLTKNDTFGSDGGLMVIFDAT